jgi:hypothetical protein
MKRIYIKHCSTSLNFPPISLAQFVRKHCVVAFLAALMRGRRGSARAYEQFLQRASMAEVRVVFPLAIRSLTAGACMDDGDDLGQVDVEEGYSQKQNIGGPNKPTQGCKPMSSGPY